MKLRTTASNLFIKTACRAEYFDREIQQPRTVLCVHVQARRIHLPAPNVSVVS
jgi:hypothetical protein